MSLSLSPNDKFSRFFKFANWLFSKALATEDMVSLYSAIKILRSSPFLFQSVTKYLSEDNAAKALFVAINLANVLYQNCYASWFLYLISSVSGVRKLFSMVLKNQLLGVFFYLSFYFRLLGETDATKFNMVASALNLPLHQDFVGDMFLTALVQRIGSLLVGEKSGYYEQLLLNLVKKVVSEQVLAASVEKAPQLLAQVLTFVAGSDTLKDSIPSKAAAVYVADADVETQSDLDEFLEYVTVNRRDIKRQVRSSTRKDKHRRKLQLQQVVESKNKDGEVVCLNTCQPRTKTKVGCYCEGDCGPTVFLGGKPWCFVDPTKCKKGKYLPRYMGRAYDLCDNTNNTTNNSSSVCFTGLEYKDCVSNKK